MQKWPMELLLKLLAASHFKDTGFIFFSCSILLLLELDWCFCWIKSNTPWSTGLDSKVINTLESCLHFIVHHECQQHWGWAVFVQFQAQELRSKCSWFLWWQWALWGRVGRAWLCVFMGLGGPSCFTDSQQQILTSEKCLILKCHTARLFKTLSVFI